MQQIYIYRILFRGHAHFDTVRPIVWKDINLMGKFSELSQSQKKNNDSW